MSFRITFLEKAYREKTRVFLKNLERVLIEKRGQAELGETILVLLVIIFLIVLGIFAYYGFFYRGLGSLGTERTDIENLIILNTFASMPETKCENDECIDVVKLLGFKELIKENKAYYLGKFKTKKIIVEFVYPESREKAKECNLDKYQQASFPNNCGYIVVYDSLVKEPDYSVSLPISLFFSNLNEFRIGILRIQGVNK